MKSGFSRNNLKISIVSSNVWRGTVAAQTNEQCLSNMQLRERILFEKPGSSVTNLFSSLQDKKSQPPQTITNYLKSYSTKSGHERADKYACQNTPKQKPSETLKPCNDCQSWGVGKLLEHLRVWLLKEESGLHVRFEDTSWSNRHDSCTKVKIVSSA